MPTRAEAKAQYEKDLAAGYSRDQAKERLVHLAQTGVSLPDPTEKYWQALIGQESGGDQSAVSPKGATGIAQVMPATGPEAAALAGVEWDPIAFKNDAAYNAKLGRAYFRKQMETNDNDPAKALAAYNAGPGALRKAGGDISKLPAETRNYVPAIMNKADKGMQPDLDSPEQVAAAQEALMSPKDRARKVYEQVLASGGSREDAKAAIQALASQNAPAPVQAPAQQAAPTGPNGVTGSYAEEPTFAQNLQSDIEKVYETDPVTAGMGRSFAGMIQGTRKLYNQATGDDEKVKELEADEKRSREFWERVDPQGSGFSQGDFGKLAGDTSTFAAAPAIKGGTLAKILYDAGIGGLQGLLQPTTENDSQALNAGLGAGVGGVVSSAGSALRGLAGTPDATRQAAASGLRSQGVDVPVGQEYNSPIGAALRKMGGQSGSAVASEQSLTSAMAKALGMPGTDITNAGLEANSRRAGAAIGDLYKNATAVPGKEFADEIKDIGRKYRLAGPVKRGDEIIAMVNHLTKKAKSGKPLTGEEYQALRTGLTADSVAGKAEAKQATGGMKRALDKMFQDQNPRPEARDLRSQYRLSQILRGGSGVPTEGMTSKQMRNRIEGAARKGAVSQEVRDLLDQSNQIVPQARVGGDAAAGAGDDMVMRGLQRPSIMGAAESLLRGLAGPASKGYDAGTIQRLVNDPNVRKSLANLLRGGIIPQATRLEQGEQ